MAALCLVLGSVSMTQLENNFLQFSLNEPMVRFNQLRGTLPFILCYFIFKKIKGPNKLFETETESIRQTV